MSAPAPTKARRTSTGAKRRVVAALLLAVGLWPGLHYALASRYGFDPWELFGWAMYALPNARVEVGVLRRVDGQSEPLFATGETLERMREFSRRRATLGRFVSTERFARRFLAEDPELDAVEVLLRTWFLDPETALLDYRDERLVYVRQPREREGWDQP